MHPPSTRIFLPSTSWLALADEQLDPVDPDEVTQFFETGAE